LLEPIGRAGRARSRLPDFSGGNQDLRCPVAPQRTEELQEPPKNRRKKNATQKVKSTHSLLLLLLTLLFLLFLPSLFLLLLGLGSGLSTRRQTLLLGLASLLLLLLDTLDTRVDGECEVNKTADLGDVLLLAARALGLVFLFGVTLVVTTI
jgi:hypothetical protein